MVLVILSSSVFPLLLFFFLSFLLISMIIEESITIIVCFELGRLITLADFFQFMVLLLSYECDCISLLN